MATQSNTDNRSKAVVAFLDGRRLKGYIYNFSTQKDRFRIFLEQDTLQREGTDIQMKDLKAIFFAKDFVGNPEYKEFQTLNPVTQGHKPEVEFQDGERIVGVTDAYNPHKIGFFIVPVDPRSNNLRVFVVTRNARQIRWI
jgi:hypothetical protein